MGGYTAAQKADEWEARYGGPGLPDIGRMLQKGATEAQQQRCRCFVQAMIACWRAWGATPSAVVTALHRAAGPWVPGVYLRPGDFATKSDAELLALRNIGVRSLAAIRAAQTQAPADAPRIPAEGAAR